MGFDAGGDGEYGQFGTAQLELDIEQRSGTHDCNCDHGISRDVRAAASATPRRRGQRFVTGFSTNFFQGVMRGPLSPGMIANAVIRERGVGF